ncbi:aldehyde dehydrogenase (NAD+)|uniref:Aldehyde dehydrogenase n=1 Tax=Brenneria salicis ATCC 15712 = DSM 30166 TaxID=714314 RepID=A0A366I0T6_9GAMM|nr:aldehyde dehydrogenase family protein [Brenneria salicis]NMN90262.1 aldehyde dehydrogenase (NAD+) [Brenneria salicis ATCC 15712 = DSM 30166]RBP58770.1 aldehyde dehydrogenase (NAD+) [Brenneria salicis ATCC 15712 = DSM 30166]RLM31160.1 aldehyde dehydrogenase [Brenneria salicis ATCC 15712 = DSM 30166]
MTGSERILSVFKSQQDFFSSYQTRDIEFRKAALQKLKKTILANKELIYDALDKDLGKPREVVDLAEIGAVILEIDTALSHIDQWSKDEEIKIEVSEILKPSRCVVRHEALGVCYIVGPFNYPFNLTLCPLIGAIAAGNTAILKPSELTPHSASVIEKVIAETFSDNYVAVIQGGKEENTQLLTLPFNLIFFTGSPGVGKIVMEAAAKHLTPVVLELGGKCPVIACEDADIDQLIESLAFSKFINSGQTCIAPDYLLVDRRIHSSLMEKLLPCVQHKYPDLASNGKVVSEKQVSILNNYLDKTQGKIVSGGNSDSEKRHFQATIIDDVSWSDALMEHEIFGPLLPIIIFDDLDTVIKQINENHPKPLALYVFTKNEQQGSEIINQIQSGDAQVNGILTHAMSSELPFGGIGPSGMGEYHGKYSFEAFSHRKSIRFVA